MSSGKVYTLPLLEPMPPCNRTLHFNALIHQVFFFQKVKHYFLLSKILLFTE